jgi:DNA (cytosine-5)-methyltransferase 1
MNKLRVLELFGGIGACSKALERLGIDYEIADYVEIDKYAVKSFNAIHNTNFEPQDITQWNKDIEVDLIMHGSPCQDFSLAGLQAGGDKDSGTRSSLMYETIRIVEKLKPKYVIWENVKNLLSKKHKHNFDAYIETMEKLGYANYYQVLNAKDYGIPQNRERVFTISIRNDIDKEFVFPEKQELKLRLKDMLEDEVDEKYYLSDKMLNCFMSNGTGKYPRRERFLQNINKDREVANTIITTEGNKPTCNFVKDTPNYIEWHEEGKLDIDCRAYKEDEISGAIMTTPKNKVLLKEQLCNKIIEEGKVKEFDVIRHSYSKSRMKDWENRNIEKNNEVPTLDTRCDCLGVTVANVSGLRIRKLTPKECWRLMGFDDEDYEKASKVNSNAQLYKQAGNSIVVNVLMAIFNELLKKEGE